MELPRGSSDLPPMPDEGDAAGRAHRQAARRPPHAEARARTGARDLIYPVGFVAAVVIGAALGGFGGGLSSGLLTLVAIPILAFSRNQVALTDKGREVARTVEEVESLKRSDAAAFLRPLALMFGGRRPNGPARRDAPPRGDRRAALGPGAGDRRYRLSPGPATPSPSLASPSREPKRLPHARRVVVWSDRRAGRGGASRTPSPRPQENRPVAGTARQGARADAPSFWDCLSPDERRALSATARRRTFGAGSLLCREGQRAEHVLVVRSGWTKVYSERLGPPRTIAIRGPGDLIGERAALQIRSRSASVVALDTVHALQMTTREFTAFLSRHPRVLDVVERQVYARLTEDRDRFARLRGQDAVADLDEFHRSGAMPGGHPGVPGLRGGGGSAGEATLSAEELPSWDGQNCSIFFSDIAGFSATHRSGEDRLSIRGAMYGLLDEAFQSSGVPWARCHAEDRGDGAMIIVPPDLPTNSVVDPLLANLGAGLRRYNQRAGETVRIQLRVALDVGPVVSDAFGVSGDAIIHAARLLDSPVLKRQLTETGAHLGVIASTFVYDHVIKHGPGLVVPDEYERVRFQVKESDITAWMRLDGATPPAYNVL